ncbi:MAG: hypothetical protein J7K23_08120 [Thermoproteales archaeon]|nr:hypothetical protein [Thermoproteales archaeon]
MNKRGQTRIIELLLATVILAAAVVFSLFFARPMRSIYVRETSTLRRLAYNVLNNYAMSGVFENIILHGNLTGRPWQNEMATFMSMTLPPEILYYLEVYHAVLRNGTVTLRLLGTITNISDNQFTSLIESESITYTYVSTGEPDKTRGIILVFHLVLGFSG